MKILNALSKISVLAILALAISGVARADSFTDTGNGNITYTVTSDFINEGTSTAPEYDIQLVINYAGSNVGTSGASLISIAPTLQLTGGDKDTGMTMDYASAGSWPTTFVAEGENSGGCDSANSSGIFCDQAASGVPVTTSSVVTFIFDVYLPSGDTLTSSNGNFELKALTDLPEGLDQVSSAIGIGTGTIVESPEPGSLALLGVGLTGLFALALFSRKRQAALPLA